MHKLDYVELSQLLENFKRGDSFAFEQIYQATYSHQIALATHLLKNNSLAEDVVQDSYLTLCESIYRIKDPKALVSYLNRITRNKCIDRLKYDSKISYLHNDISELADFITDNSELNSQDEVGNLIEYALDNLSTEDREIVEMKYFEDMRIKDISEALNLSQRTINRRLSTSLSKLKLYISRYKNSSFIFLPPFVAKPIKNLIATVHEGFNKFTTLIKETVLFRMNSILSVNSLVSVSSITIFLSLVPNNVFFTPIATDSFVGGAKIFIIENLNKEEVKDIQLFTTSGNNITSFVYSYPYISIKENGEYLIEITDSNNNVIHKRIDIKNIDNTAPRIEILNYNSVTATIRITDELSGVDAASLQIVSEDQSNISYTVLSQNDKELKINFVHNSLPFHIVINDNVNNKNNSKVTWNY